MRYCCFEIRTSCGSCGQPVPINGPFSEITCTSCFEKVRVPQDIYAGFMNDFEEEYEGNAEGEGSGGTLMSGSGTYKYGVWRLTPRCSSCKKPLVIPDAPGRIECGCGRVYHFYTPSEGLRKEVPSLRFCISREAPSEDGSPHKARHALSGDSLKPVVMSCPQCAGALSISAENERIMACGYCDSEVYIPDAIWKRLHPVKKVEEWFACFKGQTEKQLNADRRLKDKEEEAESLKGWKAKSLPEKAKKKLRPYFIFAAVFLILVIGGAALVSHFGGGKKSFADGLITLAPFAFVSVVAGAPLLVVLKSAYSSSVGPGKACKEAMAALATARGWEHSGAENKRSMGYVRDSCRGRDIEIHPDDDYAVEIEIHESIFYLNTEPPGYPQEDMYRFTTGDSMFDGLFPIRYADPEFALKIESSETEAKRILAPLFWFLKRWGSRVGKMKIDWSSAEVHLTPGCYDVMDSGGKYLPAEDIEPLFEDMMTLAEGIDAISSGKEPVLRVRPESASEPDSARELFEAL